MGRSTDQETIAIGKTVCYTHRYKEKGHAMPQGATWKAPAWVRKQGEEREASKSLHYGSCRKE